jgi:hypothetical protein
MKLKLLPLSLFLFASLSFLQITKTELICDKKWTFTSMKSGDFEMPMNPENEIWMKFYKDGKHEAFSFGKLENGTWSFNKNEDSIIFVDPRETKRVMSLDSLNTDKLYITFVDKGRKIHIEMKKDQ